MMRHFLLVTAVSLLVFQLGGCPQADPPAGGGSGQTSNSGISSSGRGPSQSNGNRTTAGSTSSADAARAPTSTSDGLTNEFASCRQPTEAATWRLKILTLVNQARTERGLTTLTRNNKLEDEAAQYACEMIQYEFFDHVNPVTSSTLKDRAIEFGYEYQVIGENLAAGQTTPEQAFADWMNSPGHRANILDARFTEIGIAVRSGGPYGLYWVQEFGVPAAPPKRP